MRSIDSPFPSWFLEIFSEIPIAGHWFEELSVGQTFEHEIRRTVTKADNMWFSNATCNPAAVHMTITRIAPVTEQLILSFIAEKVLDLPKSH